MEPWYGHYDHKIFVVAIVTHWCRLRLVASSAARCRLCRFQKLRHTLSPRRRCRTPGFQFPASPHPVPTPRSPAARPWTASSGPPRRRTPDSHESAARDDADIARRWRVDVGHSPASEAESRRTLGPLRPTTCSAFSAHLWAVATATSCPCEGVLNITQLTKFNTNIYISINNLNIITKWPRLDMPHIYAQFFCLTCMSSYTSLG